MKFILNNGTEERAFEIQPGVTIVGRASSSHVKLRSRRVSRRHLECHREGSVVRVRDLGSSNGTLVNGVKIAEPVILKDGDKLAIGDIQLRFRIDAQGRPAAPFAGSFDAFAASPANDAAPAPRYAEDEATPPDGTFVPEVYRPEGPPQPLLTQRGGRWFLRDPRTNREVEIVPKAQAAAKDERQKKLVTYGVIAAAALLALLLILPAIFSSGKPVISERHSAESRARYATTIDNAVKAFENGQADQAKTLLKSAHAELPEFKVAGILAEVIDTMTKSGDNMVSLDYEKIVTLLEEVDRLRSTARVKAFAQSQLARMEVMERSLQRIAQARNHEANGELAEAYKAANSLSMDNPVRLAHKDYIRKLQDACRLSFVAKGDRAKAAAQWDQSAAHYEEAMNYTPSVNHKNEILEKMKECSLGKADQQTLATADEKFQAKEYADALALAAKIDDASFYATQAESLKEQVQKAKDRDHVLSLYANGQAREAIKFIREHNIQSMFALVDKAASVLEAFEKAKKADEQSDRISEAIAAYRRVIDLEPDAENFYNFTSAERLEQLLADKERRAQEFVQRGREAFDNKQIELARRHWQRALSIDGRSGASFLEVLDTEARNLYIKAEAQLTKGNEDEATRLFKEVLQYAEPGSDYYNRALKKLHAIQ